MRELRGDCRDLFLGFRVALDPRKMILGLVGLLFSGAGLLLILGLGAYAGLSGAEQDRFAEAVKECRLRDAGEVAVTGLARVEQGVDPDQKVKVGGPKPIEPAGRGARIWSCLLPGRSTKALPWTPILLVLGGALWLTLIWSLLGGAIARIAAVEIARDERISTNEALHFARQRFRSFFWSPVSVALVCLFFVLANATGGLVVRIPWLGDIVGILALPLAFIGGFIALMLLIGGVLGWPLMAPALGAEGTDAFDAVSRAFSYVYSKPWHYFGYGAISKVYGVVVNAFVWVFAFMLIRFTFFSVGLGMDGVGGAQHKLRDIRDYIFPSVATGGPSTLSDLSSAWNPLTAGLAIALYVMVLLILGLAAGYTISYWYTSRTLVYFLLRKKVDATEMDEVYLDEEEAELDALGGGAPPAPGDAPAAGAASAAGAPPAPPLPASPPKP